MMELNLFKTRHLSAAQYILALHQPEDRVAVLVRNRVREQTMQRILSAEDIASPPFQTWLKEQNDAGADIFLGMNPLRACSFARTKQSIVPNFVLDTSPEKNQVIWRVDGLDREQAESLLRSLATRFCGDIAATDISRVLRIPGFANRKYNEAFLVRAIQETDTIYHLRDFTIHEDSPEAPRRLADGHNSPHRMPAGHRSQSEADWAYAKRALSRGDDPAEIVQRIADYRAGDKADPFYYAELTVWKARTEISRAPTPSAGISEAVQEIPSVISRE